MVIDDFYVVGVRSFPNKADTPLIVNPNTHSRRTFERFKTVSGRRSMFTNRRNTKAISKKIQWWTLLDFFNKSATVIPRRPSSTILKVHFSLNTLKGSMRENRKDKVMHAQAKIKMELNQLEANAK